MHTPTYYYYSYCNLLFIIIIIIIITGVQSDYWMIQLTKYENIKS